jgi:hypothetical protein
MLGESAAGAPLTHESRAGACGVAPGQIPSRRRLGLAAEPDLERPRRTDSGTRPPVKTV